MKKMNRRKAMRVILGAMAIGATATVARVNVYGSCAANMTNEDEKPKGKCGSNMRKEMKGKCGSKMNEAECKKYKEEMKGKCGSKMKDAKCGAKMRDCKRGSKMEEKMEEKMKKMKGKCGTGKCGGSMR